MKKEKNLKQAVKQLLVDIKTATDEAHPRLAEFSSYTAEKGRKFVKIIEQDTFNVKSGGTPSQRVWGFININEFTKERKMTHCIKLVTFRRGDVLMANGWKAPALNSPRGNLLDGYTIDRTNRTAPTYMSSNRTL
jgi:hypothetical protein